MDSDKLSEWRKLVIESLNEIQREFPTNQLVSNGVYIWPIIKIQLFFYAYHSIILKNRTAQSPSTPALPEAQQSFFSRGIGFVKRTFEYLYLFHLPKRRVKYLTSGGWGHRINEKGTWLNRYFVNLKGKRIHIEYTSFRNNAIDLPDRSFTLYDLFIFHKRFFSKNGRKINVEMENDPLFKRIIDMYNAKTGLTMTYNAYNKYLTRIIEWSGFWIKLLKNIKPEEIRMACYYDATMFGLCIAGNNLSIPVIDMQHGGQGPLHSAYNGFGILPEGGYNSIPSVFSVWDRASKTGLENAKIVAKEKVLLEGNPWIEFNRKTIGQSSLNSVKADILYTLQNGVPVPDFIIDVINTRKHKWVLKTHPLMSAQDIAIIKEKLIDSIKDNQVEIDEKNGLLPLLYNSRIHVSAYSGSIQEAHLVGIKTVIIDPIGYETYKLQIEGDPDYFKYALTMDEFQQSIHEFLPGENV